MKSLDSLVKQISKWAVERGIDKAEPVKQALKIGEELGELNRGILRQDDSLIEDSIGDVFIALSNLAMQYGLTLEECVTKAYNEIKDRNGESINGVFIKDEDLGDNTRLWDEPSWTELDPTKTVTLDLGGKGSYTNEQYEYEYRTANVERIPLSEYDTVKYKRVCDVVVIWTESTMYGRTPEFRISQTLYEGLTDALSEGVEVLDINVLENKYEKGDLFYRENFKVRIVDGYFLVIEKSKLNKDGIVFYSSVPLSIIEDICLNLYN